MNSKIINCERSVNRERRRFLDMMTKMGVSSTMFRAMPLLAGTLASRYAMAAGLPNKRIVFMYLPNGAPPGMWLPSSATQMNVSTRAYLPVAGVTEFTQVNMADGGHGSTYKSMASYSPKNTVDAYFANNFVTAPYKIIRAGVQSAGGELFTREAGQGASNIDGPEKLYKAFFSGTPPVSNADDSYTRVFQMSQNALTSLRKKLSTEEVQRIQAHQESLTAIEARIKAAANPVTPQTEECKTPKVFAGTLPPSGKPHIVDEGKAVSDIIIAALKCGLTNVATIQLSTDQAGWFPQGRVPNVQDSLNHHNFSHSGNDLNTANVVGLLSEVPAYFIEQLMKTKGPDGQMLIDTTVFVQVTDMGDGNHGLSGAPFLCASRMAGFSATRKQGIGHKAFMQSVIDRVGLPGVTLEG